MVSGHLVGVDIGGTKIEAVLLDPKEAVVASRRVPARRGKDNVVDDVVSLVQEVCGDLIADVERIGIGTPGQVDTDTGRIANVVNLDIDTLELGSLVEERLGVPVQVNNDVNAAAVGAESVVCGDDVHGTVVMVNFGTGLAAGMLIDGELQHGYSGAIGEIGHVPVDPNRLPCACGQRGCLETVCSGASVARLWPTDDGVPPMPDLIAKARGGDDEAQRVLGMVVHAIVDALQIVAQSVDPRMIILGGGMAKTGQPLLDVIAEELRRREETCPFLRGVDIGSRIRLAPADKPLGAIGAALA